MSDGRSALFLFTAQGVLIGVEITGVLDLNNLDGVERSADRK